MVDVRSPRELPRLELRVVAPDDAQEHARPAPGELIRRLPRALERLPRHLEQQPLLGIHSRGLPRGDPEERGVEAIDAVDESSPARVRAARLVGVGIEQRIDVPAIARHLGDGVYALVQQAPERFRRPRTARYAAGRTNDGNGLRARALECLALRMQLESQQYEPLGREARDLLVEFLAHRCRARFSSASVQSTARPLRRTAPSPATGARRDRRSPPARPAAVTPDPPPRWAVGSPPR